MDRRMLTALLLAVVIIHVSMAIPVQDYLEGADIIKMDEVSIKNLAVYQQMIRILHENGYDEV